MTTDHLILNSENSLPELPEHLLESLSALFDGELSTSESTFLLKRLEHDVLLRAHWERMQLIRESLSGQASQLASLDFSAKVMSKILAEAPPQANPGEAHLQAFAALPLSPDFSRRRAPLKRWFSGAAIAAAVACAALFLPQLQNSETATQTVALPAVAPVTVASPLVDVHQVSERIGSRNPRWVSGNRTDPVRAAAFENSMDEFFALHATGNAAAEVSGAVEVR